jgi:hypothetical protein
MFCCAAAFRRLLETSLLTILMDFNKGFPNDLWMTLYTGVYKVSGLAWPPSVLLSQHYFISERRHQWCNRRTTPAADSGLLRCVLSRSCAHTQLCTKPMDAQPGRLYFKLKEVSATTVFAVHAHCHSHSPCITLATAGLPPRLRTPVGSVVCSAAVHSPAAPGAPADAVLHA